MTFVDFATMIFIMGGGFAGLIFALRAEIGFATERALDAEALED